MKAFNLINHNQFLNVLRLAITMLLASSSILFADCSQGSSSGPKKEVFPILASFGEWNVSKDPSDGACWASSKPLNTSTFQPHQAGDLCRDQPRISVLFVDNNKVGQFAFDAGTNLSAQHAASLQTSINTLPLKLIQQHWAWVFSTEDDQE